MNLQGYPTTILMLNTHTHTHTHTHIYIYIYTHTHTHMCVYLNKTKVYLEGNAIFSRTMYYVMLTVFHERVAEITYGIFTTDCLKLCSQHLFRNFTAGGGEVKSVTL